VVLPAYAKLHGLILFSLSSWTNQDSGCQIGELLPGKNTINCCCIDCYKVLTTAYIKKKKELITSKSQLTATFGTARER